MEKRVNKTDDIKIKDEPPARPATKVKLRLDAAVDTKSKKPTADEPITVSDDGVTVLYEDNHILVAVKPQNVPSQADSSGDPDFLSMLKDYLVKKYNKPGNAYLGLLHRLDRPTGGVMVFAKTSKAAGRLSEQIRSGDFEKTYAAVVSGRPNRTGKIEHYLVKDEKTNTVTLAPASLTGAKRAESDIKILEEKDGLSLVSVRLLTGRTHQARVQLKALSSPIAGDRRYGGDKYVPAPHLALWAYKLAFTHPVTGEALKFISLPPDEFPWSEFDTDALVDLVRPTEKRHY
ncbi:MAG: RluA family pseudouridine synthase [Clostridiales bacterium]|nr:RluA family pseudouridine synthase [Clostridiales bacterium]